MEIKADITRWVEGTGSFRWPEGVTVTFPNGDKYDSTGGRTAGGVSIDYNPKGMGACGSPAHQALVKQGLV